jgi:hypothetical protein
MPLLQRSGLAALLIAALAGCTPSNAAREPAPASAATPSAEVRLVPGQRIALPGGDAVRYVALVSDSRCPLGVQCIQAGEATLRFELEVEGRVHLFELSTAPPRDAAVIDRRRVRLLDAARDAPPRARLSVEQAD